jgi:hypothetical protein
MGTTTVDGEIENLRRQLRRAEAVKATYPDAYLGQLLDGRTVWMRPSAGPWCTHVMVVTSNDAKDRLARMIPYTILRTEDDGIVYVFADNFHGGALADVVLTHISSTNSEAYAALVRCVVSETR